MEFNALDLKKIRKEKGWTQATLATKLGVHTNTIVNYEKGEPIPEAKKALLTKILDSGDLPETNGVTPYFPDVNASAGLSFLASPAQHYSIPISIPNVQADAFINVFGDSMYPKFCSGEIIGIKETQKDMVMFGHAYVIQMSDGEAYLKYVKRGVDDDHWILDNENDKYEAREFHLSKISKVFIVKAVISKMTLL